MRVRPLFRSKQDAHTACMYLQRKVPPSNIPWLTTIVPWACIGRTILPWHALCRYVGMYVCIPYTLTGCYDLEIRVINYSSHTRVESLSPPACGATSCAITAGCKRGCDAEAANGLGRLPTWTRVNVVGWKSGGLAGGSPPSKSRRVEELLASPPPFPPPELGSNQSRHTILPLQLTLLPCLACLPWEKPEP